MIKHVFVMSCLFICAARVNGQDAVVSSGGTASGNGVSVSYTVGQLLYTADSTQSGSVLKGVQQPYEIYTVGSASLDYSFKLNVFPNPTSDLLTLEFDATMLRQIEVAVVDMNGKILRYEQLTSDQKSIDVKDLASASYLYQVFSQGQLLQTFQIVKR